MDESSQNEHDAVDNSAELHEPSFNRDSHSTGPAIVSSEGSELKTTTQSDERSKMIRNAFFGMGFSALFLIGVTTLVYFLKPQDYIASLFSDNRTEQRSPVIQPGAKITVTKTPVIEETVVDDPAPDSNPDPVETVPPTTIDNPTDTPKPLTYGKVEEKIGTFIVPAGLKSITGILTWTDRPVFTLSLVLVDPDGVTATATTYPGSSFITTRPAMSFISYPKEGEWTANVYGDNVPYERGEYYFIVSAPK